MEERAMTPVSVFCPDCATETAWEGDFCQSCGARLQMNAVHRVRGTAFRLTEGQAGRFDELVTPPQRGQIFRRYAQELREMTGRAVAESPRQGRQRRAVQAAAAAFSTEPAPAAAMSAPPRRPSPPQPPAAPRDWSWLAEQQANLFLFAGAFLVVVAALIYVGYSKQAVSGPLKMALFIVYTLAFLGAGALCLRYPRVAIAGRVFLGVGMLLVPLNFVAASNIFRDEKLNAEAMWLAGSLTTLLFYSTVALLGTGRNYALGAGLALFSATAAVVAIADIPVEWAAFSFIAISLAIAAIDLVAPPLVRARLTRTWVIEGHVVAALAVAFAVIT